MEYRHEQFRYGHEVVDFLNTNNIEKENIISIYKSEYFHHLIHIAKEDLLVI